MIAETIRNHATKTSQYDSIYQKLDPKRARKQGVCFAALGFRVMPGFWQDVPAFVRLLKKYSGCAWPYFGESTDGFRATDDGFRKFLSLGACAAMEEQIDNEYRETHSLLDGLLMY